jgi:hypothetical protein
MMGGNVMMAWIKGLAEHGFMAQISIIKIEFSDSQ